MQGLQISKSWETCWQAMGESLFIFSRSKACQDTSKRTWRNGTSWEILTLLLCHSLRNSLVSTQEVNCQRSAAASDGPILDTSRRQVEWTLTWRLKHLCGSLWFNVHYYRSFAAFAKDSIRKNKLVRYYAHCIAPLTLSSNDTKTSKAIKLDILAKFEVNCSTPFGTLRKDWWFQFC